MKKTMKNLLTGLTAMAMATTAAGITVQGVSMNTSKNATLKISDTYASPGQIAKVTVSVDNNPGFVGFGATLDYDSSLQVTQEDSGSFISMFNSNSIEGNTAISAANIEEQKIDGTIVDLYFKVPETAKVGDVYNISWDKIEQFSGINGNDYDNITIDGSIKVIDDTPTFGDEEIKLTSDEEETPLQIFNINGNNNVIFASNNDDIVTVKNGKLVPKGKGVATVYALVNNTVLSCSVNVDGAIESTKTATVSELKGNVNLDPNVDAIDAGTILKYYTMALQNPNTDVNSAMNFGDVNGDGKIDAIDAGLVLKYYTQRMNNPNVTWDDIVK